METCKVPTNTMAYISSNCSFSATRLLTMLDHHDSIDEVSDISIDCFLLTLPLAMQRRHNGEDMLLCSW